MRWVVVLGLALLGACELAFDTEREPEPIGDPPIGPVDAGMASPGNCAATVGCGEGRHCEPQCAPPGANGCTEPCHTACVADVSCANVECGPGASCIESCLHDCSGFSWICNQTCVQHAYPGTCDRASCRETPPACPEGTVPGVEGTCYTGFCIPRAQCGTIDPGSCSTAAVACDALPPACPVGTTPGVSGACWSGFCLPASACTCAALTTQDACDARPDCFSITSGVDCDCRLEICECAPTSGAFERCQSRE